MAKKVSVIVVRERTSGSPRVVLLDKRMLFGKDEPFSTAILRIELPLKAALISLLSDDGKRTIVANEVFDDVFMTKHGLTLEIDSKPMSLNGFNDTFKLL